MPRKVQFREAAQVTPCPMCKNRTDFTAHSMQVAEDACEVWIVCKCGFDPTREHTEYRLENVWGGTGPANVVGAKECWNDAIEALFTTPPKEE